MDFLPDYFWFLVVVIGPTNFEPAILQVLQRANYSKKQNLAAIGELWLFLTTYLVGATLEKVCFDAKVADARGGIQFPKQWNL